MVLGEIPEIPLEVVLELHGRATSYRELMADLAVREQMMGEALRLLGSTFDV